MDLNDDIPRTGVPSKSQRKREVEALQKLGEELVRLPESQFAALPLPEQLRDAVEQARHIGSHGALKRQRQYIGRLMRETDTHSIRLKLDELRGTDKAARARFRQLERWRDRLIAEGDAALGEFLTQYPRADHPHLRRLMRGAARDTAAGRSPRRARELFRYLQTLT
jgi:Uncharacterized protein conserved in bacteria